MTHHTMGERSYHGATSRSVYDMVSVVKTVNWWINAEMPDQIPVLKPLLLEGNVAENWRR